MMFFVEKPQWWYHFIRWDKPMWLWTGDILDITFDEDGEKLVRLEGKKGDRAVFCQGQVLLATEREWALKEQVARLQARIAHLEERHVYTDGWYE
jgi:hypothetical protein